MKIISLVPSITEALFDFGLYDKQIIGRTKFCVQPKDKVESVPKIGGTKNINIPKILELKPDLIIANKEENDEEQVKELMKHHEVWVTDIKTVDDNVSFLKALGKRLNKVEIAKEFIQKIKETLSGSNSENKLKAVYLIWKNPYMTIGGDTFINDVLKKIGIKNIFENQKRYPEISVDEMKNTDIIFLSSEPYPFKEKHLMEIEEVTGKKTIRVDGEAFSWYGTQLAKRREYFKELLNELGKI
ncbi:ABC transporter substrate-binding protein [uncultured Chryseobacterium sp.]|uniref:ABC transporter substrate-binding protein n=1 Tax=uncultured Chryseobacterium sp. TaxID=259322 RepID=UPI00260BD74F|nr:helical backbone metal receptor [uncultured Chryseobacterium sp.]